MSDPKSAARLSDLAKVPIGVALALAAVGAYELLRGGGMKPALDRLSSGASGRTAVRGLPAVGSPGRLSLPKGEVKPTVIVDVWEPAKIREALSHNAWVQRELAEPLGQGLLGSWAGFLQSKGEDLKAEFKGTVLDFFASQLLASPFKLVWFAGGEDAPVPALILPAAGAAARGAFEVVDRAVARGSLGAAHCPRAGGGPDEAADDAAEDAAANADAGAKPAKPEIEIHRWLIADRPLFAAQRGDRLAFARTPIGTLEGLCVELPDSQRTAGADLEASFRVSELGHEADVFAQLLGVGPAPRLALAVKGDGLTPVGLVSDHGRAGQLGVGAPPEGLLKAIPAGSAVILTLQLALPAKLDQASLERYLSGKDKGERAVRPAALVWTPHGYKRPPDFSLLWSEARDEPFLRKAFSGPNHLSFGSACGLTAISTTGEALGRLQAACAGASPSVLSSAPAVASGLRSPASVQLGLDLGALLSGLTLDAYRADQGAKPPPPEIEKARQELLELPFLGWRAVAKEDAWVPEGYRS